MLQKGNLHNAELVIHEMIQWCRDSKDVPNTSTCLLLAAQVHLSRKSSELAMKAVQECKDLAETIGDEKKAALSLCMMASIMESVPGMLESAECKSLEAWGHMRNTRDSA